MIHWPIVWTHDRAGAKQGQARGVRGGDSQGIIMHVLYTINPGFNTVICLGIFLGFVVGLGIWPWHVWFKVLWVDFGISKTPEMLIQMVKLNGLIHTWSSKKIYTAKQSEISSLHHTLQMVAPNMLPASWIKYFTPRCQTVLQWARLYFFFCHLNFWAHFHANGKFIVTNRVTLAVTPYLNEYQVWLYFPAAIAH